MSGNTHMVIGLAAVSSLMVTRVIEPHWVTLVSAAVASYLPDIDHDRGTINQLLHVKKRAYILAALASIFFERNLNGLILALFFAGVATSRHRAFTHSFLAMAMVAIVCFHMVEEPMIEYGIFVGYFMHILADFFTKQGVELLYPWDKNIRFFLYIKTGGSLEQFIRLAAMSICLYDGYLFLKLTGQF